MEAVITGSVSQYDKDKTVVYVYVVPIVGWSYKVGATLRMIDASNGDIVYAHSASGSSGNNYTEAGQEAVKKLLGPLLTSMKTSKG